MKKNGFLTFMCACVPGFGQMYQGYMKRGLSLAVWFCAVIAVTVFTRVYALWVILPVIWAYSFFDTFNIRALTAEQRAAFADGFLPSGAWQNDEQMRRWTKDGNMGRVVGWACIGVGALVVLGMVWDVFYGLVWQYFPALGGIVQRVPTVVVAALVILLGVRLLRGGKAPAAYDDEGDATYAPPRADARADAGAGDAVYTAPGEPAPGQWAPQPPQEGGRQDA